MTLLVADKGFGPGSLRTSEGTVSLLEPPETSDVLDLRRAIEGLGESRSRQ